MPTLPTGEPGNARRRTHGRLGHRLTDAPTRSTVGGFTRGTHREALLSPSGVTYTGLTDADVPVSPRATVVRGAYGLGGRWERPNLRTPAHAPAPRAPRTRRPDAQCPGCGLSLLPSGRCPDPSTHAPAWDAPTNRHLVRQAASA